MRSDNSTIALDTLRFVKNHAPEVHLLQQAIVLPRSQHFICCEHNVTTVEMCCRDINRFPGNCGWHLGCMGASEIIEQDPARLPISTHSLDVHPDSLRKGCPRPLTVVVMYDKSKNMATVKMGWILHPTNAPCWGCKAETDPP